MSVASACPAETAVQNNCTKEERLFAWLVVDKWLLRQECQPQFGIQTGDRVGRRRHLAHAKEGRLVLLHVPKHQQGLKWIRLEIVKQVSKPPERLHT